VLRQEVRLQTLRGVTQIKQGGGTTQGETQQ